MLGTGLRTRFFIITFAVLLVVSIAAVGFYSFILKKERMLLIDSQIRSTATALVDSELGDLRKINFRNADHIISEELGESRIGKFFVIRGADGKIIYESYSRNLLPIPEVYAHQQWFEFSTKGKFIRGLNLRLPRFSDRTLQVGLILDEQLIHPNDFSNTSLIFIIVVVVLGLLISFFLTSFLVKPIADLENFLSEVTLATKKQAVLPNIPAQLFPKRSPSSKDEFERLIFGLETLVNRINRNYQFSRIWAYQMAHELKTPLSFLTIEIESFRQKYQIPEKEFEELNFEVKNISETINSFLNWAELENSEQQRHLFLNRLTAVAQRVMKSLPEAHDRFVLSADSDPIIVSNPQHLEQLLINLLQNALNYSPVNSPVHIRISDQELVIEDQGSGIPMEVLKRLGEPFNRGAQTNQHKKGHGLGLAWVYSVCRLYSWKIDFQSYKTGTKVRVIFPVETEESETQRSELV